MKNAKLLFASFLLLLTFSFSNCTKDGDIKSPTSETLARSNWSVDYYFDGQDMTNNYSDYQLSFSNTGLLVAQKNKETFTGTWANSLDGNNDELLDLNFNTADPQLLQLNHQWKLVNENSVIIEFENSEYVNPTEILRIKKQ